MYITSLSLIGCKRFLNKGTREIHYTPKSPLQLIIGQNGHGKSSLLEELSPLPAVPANYNKGGSKQFECEHNTHNYRLTSDFSKGSSHSFLKDGVELNPGGTITVQKTLVEQEFGYTNDLHELLLGRVKFTKLTAKARREWFVKLCETDVSYATRVYATLAQSARNVVGALKHTQQKLATETLSLLDENAHAELVAKSESLLNDSFALAGAQTPNAHWGQRELNEYEKLQHILLSLSNKSLSRKIAPGGPTIEVLQNDYNATTRDLNVAEAELSALKREFDGIHELVDQLTDAEDIPEAELLEELQTLRARLPQIKTSLSFPNLEDVELAIANASDAVRPLNDLLMQLPINKDAEVYNKESVRAAQLQRDALQQIIDKGNNLIAHAEHRCAEMTQGKDQTCPKCQYVWIPGFSETEHYNHQTLIKVKTEEVSKAQLECDQINQWLEAANEWRDHFVRYSQLTNTYPRLRPFWDTLVADYKIYNAPKSLIGALDRYLAELYKVREKTSIEARLELLNATLDKRRLLSSAGTETLLHKRNALELEISDATAKVQLLKLKAQDYKHRLDGLIEYTNEISQIERLYNAAIELLIQRTKAEQNQILNDQSQQLRQQAGLLSAKLQQSTAVIEIVAHLQRSLEELESDQQLYEVILEELSPTTGIIADTLKGFISTFAMQVNDVIAKIWNTPLQILPCNISEGNLDYVFPFTTVDQTPIADVGMGSTGECEVIDFAFRLIAMLYLKMEHYPLLLDEVGASFHELNRNSLFNYIKLLVESRRISQVFVVSHFATTHGSLTHADLNILDPTGVLVTPTANKYFLLK